MDSTAAPWAHSSILLAQTAARLAAHDDAPGLTAQALLAHVLGVSRASLLARPERQLTPEQAARFEQLAARAAEGEPLAYLIGEREFYGLNFWVDARVLVPRPETELLVDLALAERPGRILEVGAGSGCVAVTLAAHLPKAHITAVDISPRALTLARRNAQRHNVDGRISFVLSDLLAAFASPVPLQRFDVIAANLPYIDSDELGLLPVARHEPRLALDGGPGGLALVGRLLAQVRAVACLKPGGRVLLEIGSTQGAAALALAGQAWPAARASLVRDLAGLDRVLAVQALEA